MGKLPAIFLAAIALWLAVNVIRYGPEQAMGSLFGLLSGPQYGEADRPTISGDFADEILEEGEEGDRPAPPAFPVPEGP